MHFKRQRIKKNRLKRGKNHLANNQVTSKESFVKIKVKPSPPIIDSTINKSTTKNYISLYVSLFEIQLWTKISLD